MGLQGHVGSAHDTQRIRQQEKQREEERKRFEELKKQKEDQVNRTVRQFGKATSEVCTTKVVGSTSQHILLQALENAFKAETVGLVTREEFMEKRKTLAERLEQEAAERKRAAEHAARQDKARRKRIKAVLSQKSKLSFLGDEEDAVDSQPAAGEDGSTHAPGVQDGLDGEERPAHTPRLGKDPTVPTEFLPDKDREAHEAALRAQLKAEYEAQQSATQAEPLVITYSYWNGTGNRRTVTVRKGDTVGAFLAHVREQLCKDFREARTMSVADMMYVKEDMILPHSVTFYSLIQQRAKGKGGGSLFRFGVYEDVRLKSDARVEKDESHAGKVVDRHWYEKNRHIFPANRWEVFDPEQPDKHLHGASDAA